MKIADYGKAITSYIESPTTAQKLQAKEKAQTLGRTLLAEGSEDIVEPSKSMQVDTTTKGLDLFTLQDFKDKAEIYVGAYHNNALPIEDIRSALNKFTQKGIDDGTFTADEAFKVVQDFKSYFVDLAQKQRLRGIIPEGIGTVEREDKFTGSGDYAKKYLKYKDKPTQDKFNKIVNDLRTDMTLDSAISEALRQVREETKWPFILKLTCCRLSQDPRLRG